MENVIWRYLSIVIFVSGIILLDGCKKEQDEQLPVVTLLAPSNCDSILQGNFINLKATFTDNEELARYAVDIHHNFSHTSYASSDQGCDFDQDKSPFNPFKYGVVEEIPAGLKTYSAELNIMVPESTDKGDYFLVVYAQDKRGLQSWHSISLKFFNNDP